jgi:hypothetical protein
LAQGCFSPQITYIVYSFSVIASLVIVQLIFYSSPICRAATSELCVPTQWSLRRTFVVVKAVKSQDLLAPGAMNAICMERRCMNSRATCGKPVEEDWSKMQHSSATT